MSKDGIALQKRDSKTSKTGPLKIEEDKDPYGDGPIFIYGGPWIKITKPSIFLETTTPLNIKLSGAFKKSYAYYSLKERTPTMLTKVIDAASKLQASQFVAFIAKLKHDLVTNKPYAKFTAEGEEYDKWNGWIDDQSPKNYFGNSWVWTECYIYRKIQEGCELNGLADFDPFTDQKNQAFQGNIEPMCVVAEKMIGEFLEPKEEKAKKKEEWVALMKVLADDSGKSFDQLLARTNKIRNNIEKVNAKDRDKPEPNWWEMFPSGGKGKKGKGKGKGKPKPAEGAEAQAEPVEPPKNIPCPAKMTVPQFVFLDFVCDNAGYELFADLCIAHYAIAQGFVDKVRFHVKKYPWFISDVTRKDFKYVVDQCKSTRFSRDAKIPVKPVPPPKPTAEGEPPPEPEPQPTNRFIRSDALNQLGQQWQKYIDEGQFMVMDEDFWTYPHTYNDMKRIDPYLYRKLQYASMIIFKGDLNYRKLLGERNAVQFLPIEPNLQGFLPAPLVALRTVKAELICGLPKGRYEQLNKFDPKWMEKGSFGVIQMCKKAEAFPKQPNKPCEDYGDTCYGERCPEHTDI